MTHTQNLGLTKFESTDKYRISQSENSMNKNMELIDAAVGDLTEKSTDAETRMTAMQDGYAILANGNTHPAIANGQAVYVKNHGSLAEGLYWAKSAIAVNATLSTSNLEADSTGGLNKLKGQIDALNSNLKWTNVPVSAIFGTINNMVCKKNANTVYVSIEVSGPINAYASFLSGFPATAGMYYGEMMSSDASTRVRFYIQQDGQWFLRSSLEEGKTVRTSMVLPLNV